VPSCDGGCPVADDLVARVREALGDVEWQRNEFHRSDCELIRSVGYSAPCTCGEPERRRLMAAAHRKILDLHRPVEHPEYPDACNECGDTYPCATVLALAEGCGSKPAGQGTADLDVR
jgi:hypothetical protein